MKKLLFTIGGLLFVFQMSLCVSPSTKNENRKEIFYADPTIFYENETYYMIGTRNSRPQGFIMLESKDLISWKMPSATENMTLKKGDDVYGEQGFWAPQILNKNNTYYLTYTANEQTCLATSDKINGKYTQKEIRPIDDTEKNIDSYIFEDSDGKFYLYHVRFNKGNFLWVAELDLKTGKIKQETLKECFKNTQPWEATPAYKSDPIMEGPTVIKMDDIYYMFYSANHFQSLDYAVGYATAKSPYGPWEKYAENPIIHRTIVKENGSGHGDIFFDSKNHPYYVYHVHYSDSVVSPRRTRIVPLEFKANPESKIYDISVKADEVIIPVID